MYLKLGLLVWLAWCSDRVSAGGDDGPGDPDFSANDGDLDSPVRPIEAPQGNYNIIEQEGV